MYNNPMQRILLKIQYDGRDFYGWQKQEGKRTVQGELETALCKLLGEEVEIFGSGRTDRGVHALDQSAHFDMNKKIPIKNLPLALNNLLPNDISVKKARSVKSDFHARFDIVSKTYLYRVYNAKQKNALVLNRAGYVNYDLDINKMREVAKLLEGKHNFKGFCSTNTNVKSFDREIYSIDIKKKGNFFEFRLTGNGFLYNMVRIIVGSLIDVGRGLLTEKDILLALEKEDRSFAGKTMPPEGLFLEKTNYDFRRKK